MKYVITGADEHGASRIESITVSDGPVTAHGSAVIYSGPAVPGRIDDLMSGDVLPVAPAAGTAIWMLVDFEPGRHYPFHHTESVDFATVVQGTIDFGLDSDTIRLEAGDCVLVNGVGHSWYTEQGCRVVVTMLGAER